MRINNTKTKAPATASAFNNPLKEIILPSLMGTSSAVHGCWKIDGGKGGNV